MTCPKCRGRLRVLLVPVEAGNLWSGARVESVELDLCEACGGAWFDAGEAAAYLGSRLEGAPPPPRLAPKFQKLLDRRIGDCPRCRIILEEKRRAGSRVDVCPQCGGLWLDADVFPREPRPTWTQRLGRLFRSDQDA
ncbi:MAG: zf-TFIIB domain-containing protein [Elusimicrobia bacterium]|nr:zf-TFIIB domain-containing protein [Elusimicrobiota bacterium]